VASATRDGKRLIAVVLGTSSGTMRAVRAAQLLDRGFASSNGLGWLRPSLGIVNNLPPVDASPPNLRDEVCGGKHHRQNDDDDAPIASSAGAPSLGSTSSETGANGTVFLAAGLKPPMPKPSEWLAASPAASEPIVVYTGPTRSGAALVAAVAADSDSQTKGRRGKRARVAKKPDAVASETKPAEAKPARPVRHASAKPDAGAKPAAARPAPRTAAKPKPKSTDNKPAG
jgi:D-alanyl-D-alanine carboxypeptidase